MKRWWLALVVSLALVAAACGGSDDEGGDSAGTDDAQQQADTDGADADGADADGADAEGGDAEGGDDDGEASDGDAGSGDDDGGGADAATPSGGLSRAIYDLIVDDPTFDSDTFSEEQAACVANRSVDEVGEDRFADYGITAETVEDSTLNDIVFDEEDADKLAEVFVECGDMMALMLEGFAGDPGNSEEEECIAEQITEDDIEQFFSLNFQGRDDEMLSVFGTVFVQCAGLGGGDDLPDDLEIPDGVDDIMMEILTEELNLDSDEVACLEGELDGGLSLQDPTQLASAMATCDIQDVG